MGWTGPIDKISEHKYRIPKSYKQGMRTDGIIYADKNLIDSIKNDNALEQVANVAFLPGIVGNSLAMPDIHWGYGFCIGGVAATDPEKGGVISPGGVGFDINCGVRLVKTKLSIDDVKNKLSKLADTLYQTVPCGLGSKGNIKISLKQEKKLLTQGVSWAVSKGYGVQQDIERCEDKGCIEGANPDYVSQRALQRGTPQAGTLGSGNHFLEIQAVDKVLDKEVADRLGIRKGQVTVMIHTGSRGLGYQICDDYARLMVNSLSKFGIDVPDKQLACAPLESTEAKRYLGAMRCAANYAWVNRQVLMHLVRKSFQKVFSKKWESLGMDLVYDVAHNVAKFEKHIVEGNNKTLCIHRKGATRAFGPGNPELPLEYRDLGQPVIIPGDMGTFSYLLVGTQKAEESFFSTCHGAGRIKSRRQAKKTGILNNILEELGSKGIQIRAKGKKTILEEAPSAYKDVTSVVNVMANLGFSKKVCRMVPLGVVKG